MRIVFLALLVALLGAVTPISAQYPEDIEVIDHFQLWHACQPAVCRSRQIRGLGSEARPA